jgi:hypothetical protein
MKQPHIYLEDLHFEHILWKRRLLFEKDELRIYQNRLEEVSPKWTDINVKKKVEHFHNVFLINNNVLDELIHDINSKEREISLQAKDNPIAIDHVYFDDHSELRERVETQLKLYGELKHEYLDFLRVAM